MSYDIQAAAQPRRPPAAVTAASTWQQFPGQRRGMLQADTFCRLRAAVGASS